LGSVDEITPKVDFVIKKPNAVADALHKVQGIKLDFLIQFSIDGIGL
jgi:hypothetical protein